MLDPTWGQKENIMQSTFIIKTLSGLLSQLLATGALFMTIAPFVAASQDHNSILRLDSATPATGIVGYIADTNIGLRLYFKSQKIGSTLSSTIQLFPDGPNILEYREASAAKRYPGKDQAPVIEILPELTLKGLSYQREDPLSMANMKEIGNSSGG
jgi:hypothetical protein